MIYTKSYTSDVRRLLNEQAGLFSLLIWLGEQADEQAKLSYTIC
jgi:hypothetical protein